MNRTGLHIALFSALVIGVIFGLFPRLDLYFAGLFYDTQSQSFPFHLNRSAQFARDAAMWIAWAFAVPSILALVVKCVSPRRRLLVSGRATLFLFLSIFLSAIVFSNVIFKSHWGRPRPVATAEFNGPWAFKAWWDPTGQCPRNCSFYSGEATTAFWTYAPAALAPAAVRPLAYAAATLFGIATGVLRMSFGGHYFTDVAAGGIVTFFIIWLLHGFFYRWPSTRMSDDEIDAMLTRWALPGYHLMQRLAGRVRVYFARLMRRRPRPTERS